MKELKRWRCRFSRVIHPFLLVFFLCFLALFYSVLCLNFGTKPKLGLVLCFLPLVFVFSPLSLLNFLCYVSMRLVCWAYALGEGKVESPKLEFWRRANNLSGLFQRFFLFYFCLFISGPPLFVSLFFFLLFLWSPSFSGFISLFLSPSVFFVSVFGFFLFPPTCDLSFSGFYSQRTIRFFQPLIAGVMAAMAAAGVRWRRWTAYPQTVPFWILMIICVLVLEVLKAL